MGMKELLTVVTRKGQITVPAAIRKELGIREGDKLAVSVEDRDSRQVRLRPVRSVAELTFGSVTPRRRPEDLRALREQFEEGVADEVLAETPNATPSSP
jgi:AbrB family looped-hinge helix DNA binding protein